MKTTGRLCFLFMLFATASCQWGTKPESKDSVVLNDTLTYSYKIIHKRAADCGSKPDSACTVVKISYPFFNGQKALNDSVVRNLTSLFAMDGKPDSSLELMSEHFFKNYTNFRKTDPRSAMYFTLDSHARILMQDSSLITLQVGGYNFQGGAHGGSATFFINWDTKAKKSIKLKDILTDGYQDKLNTEAERNFRRDEKLKDTSSLARDYFFKDNKFALNNNFVLTPLGIKFLYNQYEIKPYAAGITELFIPYQQIKSLLRPGSVVAKFAK